MNYNFVLNARVKEGDPFEEKHYSFINFLKTIDGEWGMDKDVDYPFPKYSKGDFSAIFSFYRKFNGKMRGNSFYSLRNKLTDTHSSDDRIFLEFNSKNICQENLYEIFKSFCIAFGAYRASIAPDNLTAIDQEWPFEIRSKLNFKKCLSVFCPFQFLDGELVQSIFGFTSQALYERLINKIFNVEMWDNGIFIQASSRLMTLEEAKIFNEHVQDILGVKLPYCSGVSLV